MKENIYEFNNYAKFIQALSKESGSTDPAKVMESRDYKNEADWRSGKAERDLIVSILGTPPVKETSAGTSPASKSGSVPSPAPESGGKSEHMTTDKDSGHAGESDPAKKS